MKYSFLGFNTNRKCRCQNIFESKRKTIRDATEKVHFLIILVININFENYNNLDLITILEKSVLLCY